jgi:hypothetical protein
VSGRSDAGTAAARWRTVWRKHEAGVAGREIARSLSITEGAVRYYLAKGRPAELPRNQPAQLRPRSSAPELRSSSAGNVVPIRRTS